MVCAAVFQLFDAVGIVFMSALRGAGDTFWPMVIASTLAWVVVIGGGYAVAVFVPQWTSIGPWGAASLYVILVGVVMAARFEAGAWKRIHLVSHDAG